MRPSDFRSALRNPLLWGALSIVFVVIPAVKHDVLWMLWLAWFFAVLAAWDVASDIFKEAIDIFGATCVGLLLSSIGLYYLYDYLSQEDVPDIKIEVINALQPDIKMKNVGNYTANVVRYAVAIFNLDATNHYEPLPILGNGADFIHPGQSQVNDLFSGVASLIPAGSHLFGSIGVSCENCIRGRTYWIDVHWQQGGWFSELVDERDGATKVPHGTLDMANLYPFILQSIPTKNRTPIPR